MEPLVEFGGPEATRSLLGDLVLVQESGRVLAASNVQLVRRIGDIARSMKHHPAGPDIMALVDNLLAKAGTAEQEAPPDSGAPTGAVCSKCGGTIPEGAEACPECGGPAKGGKAKGGTAVKEGQDEFSLASGWIMAEAPKDRKGSRWAITVIESGVSKNDRLWTPELLESPAFLRHLRGADIYEDHPGEADARQYPVRRVRELIGSIRNPKAVREGDGVRVRAEAVILSEQWRQTLLNAHEMGELARFMFSVNARGLDPVKEVDGRRLRVVTEVFAVPSVDLVTRAGAGGRFDALLESANTEVIDMTPEELQKLLADAAAQGAARARAEWEASSTTPPPEPATEAVVPAPPAVPAPAAVATPAAVAEAEAAAAKLKALVEAAEADAARRAAQAMIDAKLGASNLPAALREAAAADLAEATGRRALNEAEIDGVISKYRKIAEAYATRLPESAGAPGQGLRMGATDREHYRGRMLATLNTGLYESPKDAEGTPYTPFGSLREAYYEWCQRTGDPYALNIGEAMAFALAGSRYASPRDSKRIQESLATASWAEVVQDSLYNSLLQNYRALPYNDWEKLVSTVEGVADFRTRHWTRVGGYGDLPSVAEGAAYQPAASPGDEEVTYSVSKRGMLEQQITMELIANDQIGALARIPRELANAAKRTLHKFVFDMVTGQNPTMGYDSVALYHTSSHGPNSTTNALSVSSLNAAIIAMEAQTARLSSNEVLGVRNTPRYLIVSRNLRARAQRIVNPSDAYAYGLTPAATTPGANVDTDANLDPHMFKGSGIQVVVYDYHNAAYTSAYNWTNATDWYLVADPRQRDTMILGFLNGRREPELFMQDDPNAGLGFEADVQAMKVRHIYGGVIVDHTAFHRDLSAS